MQQIQREIKSDRREVGRARQFRGKSASLVITSVVITAVVIFTSVMTVIVHQPTGVLIAH